MSKEQESSTVFSAIKDTVVSGIREYPNRKVNGLLISAIDILMADIKLIQGNERTAIALLSIGVALTGSIASDVIFTGREVLKKKRIQNQINE